MDPIEIEGGEVLASLEDRTITGLLIPYNELGRTNVGQFQVDAGVIQIPADPSVVGINTDHDRYSPVGRATRIWEEPTKGILASFSIANTPEGDAALADARNPNGKRRRLSGEFRTGIKAGRATGGILSGAALVVQGAFKSAAVLASDTPDLSEPVPESSSTSQYTDRFTDADGVEWERVSTSTSNTTVTKVSGDNTDKEDEETPVGDQDTTTVNAGIAPATITGRTPAAVTTPRVNKLEVLAAFASFQTGGIPSREAHDVLAALADITTTGAAGLPGAGVVQPNWIGLIDLGVEYVREYITLCKLGTDITFGGKKGYIAGANTKAAPRFPTSGDWAGDKKEIATGKGWTAALESKRYQYARGADIAREFFDLPGGLELIDGFLKELVTDHLMWSDEKARQTIVNTAGAPIAPKVYPGVDGHDYAGAMGQLIQGILLVKRRKADGKRDIPTYAIANEEAYEELVYTPKDLIPEFVTFTVGTDGRATADGKVLVIQGDTGVQQSSSVIVGADYAIEFDELPGGPLHVDALDLARGGVDKAIHGYLQEFVKRPEAVVHVGTPDPQG